jgi:MAP/microtubule affinity-regulating kinase
MLIDDPWINEGYSDSPIDRDVSQQLSVDDGIIKLIEQRYKIDKDTIVKSLKEGVYDDISAIYYLLYYEKETRGKIEGEVHSMGPTSPVPKSLPGSSYTPAAANGAAAKPTVPDMNKIAEDEVADEPAGLGGNARPLQSAKPRKRRVTVGASDVDKPEKEEPVVLKNAPKEEEVPPPPAKIAPPPPKQEPVKETPPSPPAEHESQAVGNRKRHNTIVGIFRNTIRRPSEVNAPPTPLSPQPQGNHQNQMQIQESDESEPNTTPNEPRSLRFTFNSNSTSSKPPDDIVQEVISTCTKYNISHKTISRYVLECTSLIGGGAENLKLEVEICKLPRLKNLHGLKFKRLSGSSSDYRDVCEKILATIQL